MIGGRTIATSGAAAASGLTFMICAPWPADNAVLRLIAFERPALYLVLHWTYVILLFTTPYLACSLLLSVAYIFSGRREASTTLSRLPPYPDPAGREALFLVIGERHHPTQSVRVPAPTWITIPERGLFTGITIVGATGSGKTAGCMYPFAHQIFGFRPHDETRRIGGLVLEVKGDFCYQVRRILEAHGREADYLEVGLDGPWRYNPLHNDLDAYTLAYGIAALLNNIFGKGKEPFWQQAYTNLVKFLILLYKVLDDYVTLFDVYEGAINADLIARKIEEGGRRFSREEALLVDSEAYMANDGLWTFAFRTDPATRRMRAVSSPSLRQFLEAGAIPYEAVETGAAEGQGDRRAQFEAVKRWFYYDWRRIEPKLRTSIVEGISVFLSLFDDSPAMKRVFCPPRECYDPVANADGRYGRPLPSFADLVEQGRVCALNFPVGANPGLAKTIGTLMKQDFQRAVLNRIPKMAQAPDRSWRDILFLCDEYHAFATVGENDPTGDEKFFGLSRQARCIPIVATQSLSSLRSALPGESWRTLVQAFRTKIFLALSDDFSARVASELCGRDERLKPHYNLSESGQDARISVLTGQSTAHKATFTTSKSYHLTREPVFEPKRFTELGNAQAIVLAYDGRDPLPPTLCYLKPHYLDADTSYFEQLDRGLL